MHQHALLEIYPMVHNSVEFNLSQVRLGLSENGVGHIRADCRYFIPNTVQVPISSSAPAQVRSLSTKYWIVDKNLSPLSPYFLLLKRNYVFIQLELSPFSAPSAFSFQYPTYRYEKQDSLNRSSRYYKYYYYYLGGSGTE